jgi:protein-S-isoprenylcysteine O-methyltransferase Ste14
LFKKGFILPVMVTGVIPTVIALTTGVWHGASVVTIVMGGLLCVIGLTLLTVTTGLFARHHGSLAPWNPPTEMVITGPYRYCRNPMITGIYTILLGEALALQSVWNAGWMLMFVVGMSSHIVFQEEPLLRQRFGDAYKRYCASVPRWLPRTKPFSPSP